MTCGIYCITNTVNNKKYIGQSKHIERRWKEHIKDLNKGKHRNSHLQNSWSTYGVNKFTFAIIEICEEDELTSREDYWINYYNTLDRDYGYNLRDAGSSGRFSKESRKRMSQSQTGLNIGEKNSAAKITEDQAKEIVRLLQENHTIKEIMKILDVPYKTIYHIRNGENWIYLTDGITFPTRETSKYKSVSFDKSYNKWRANVSFNKKRVYLKYFDTEIEAAIARDKVAKKYFGNRTVLNFPE